MIEIGDAIYPAHTPKLVSSGETLEIIKEFMESYSHNNTNIEMLKQIFELMEGELLENFERQPPLERVNLERSYLFGLNTRRSEMEILAFILNAARGGAKKTEILYQANLSGKQLKNYLTFLLNAGFIDESKVSRRGSSFSTTHKGNEFLFHWIKILFLLET